MSLDYADVAKRARDLDTDPAKVPVTAGEGRWN
jgi:hypothetical protein